MKEANVKEMKDCYFVGKYKIQSHDSN